MPKKPAVYTSKHPVNLKEALFLYANTRTVNGIQASTMSFNQNNWPLLLWVNPFNIKFGFFNKLYYRKWHKSFNSKRKFTGIKNFDYLSIPYINQTSFKKHFDESILEGFDVNKIYVQKKLKSNHLLLSKSLIIDEIFNTFNKQLWTASICTILPILDFLTREILNTKNLSTDMGKISKLFEQNGFSLETVDYLMPHITLVMSSDPEKKLSKKEKDELHEKVKNNNFGIIGPALSSFLRFANHYYGYYREDIRQNNIINRHAILHGSTNSFGNKVNTVILITFLFLLLELEPVFNILLKED